MMMEELAMHIAPIHSSSSSSGSLDDECSCSTPPIAHKHARYAYSSDPNNAPPALGMDNPSAAVGFQLRQQRGQYHDSRKGRSNYTGGDLNGGDSTPERPSKGGGAPSSSEDDEAMPREPRPATKQAHVSRIIIECIPLLAAKSFNTRPSHKVSFFWSKKNGKHINLHARQACSLHVSRTLSLSLSLPHLPLYHAP